METKRSLEKRIFAIISAVETEGLSSGSAR